MPVMIIGHSNHELVFEPDQEMFESEARLVESLNEMDEGWSRGHSRIATGSGFAMRYNRTQGRLEDPGAASGRNSSFLIGF